MIKNIKTIILFSLVFFDSCSKMDKSIQQTKQDNLNKKINNSTSIYFDKFFLKNNSNNIYLILLNPNDCVVCNTSISSFYDWVNNSLTETSKLKNIFIITPKMRKIEKEIFFKTKFPYSYSFHEELKEAQIHEILDYYKISPFTTTLFVFSSDKKNLYKTSFKYLDIRELEKIK